MVDREVALGATQRAGRNVSMSDVAAAAGVSQQTVSRVVNGAPNVSEKTRAMVLEAMRELGFRPNYAGRSLRGVLSRGGPVRIRCHAGGQPHHA